MPFDKVSADVVNDDLEEALQNPGTSRHHIEWIIFNKPARRILIAMLVVLVAFMTFQSEELWQERIARGQSRKIVTNQSQALKDLGTRVKQDQQFFDLVGRLIVIGQDQSPQAQSERQAILRQLDEMRIQHEKDAAASQVNQGSPGTSSATTAPRASTTTTEGSQGRSPPSSTTTSSSSTTTMILPPLPTIPSLPLPSLPQKTISSMYVLWWVSNRSWRTL